MSLLAISMIRERITDELGVNVEFDAGTEAAFRTQFLADYLDQSGMETYVLGISGGVDSTTAGAMAQYAVEQLRDHSGVNATFIAVRLPYGEQQDEAVAQAALAFIGADKVMTVNIKPMVDATMESLQLAGALTHLTEAQVDFLKGNVKARARMTVQYAIAGAHKGLVIGTDHAAEALMGFFTKGGDGMADILPLSGLTKGQVRAIAAHLGAVPVLAEKPATADLEDLAPGKLDEEQHGVSYEHIDAFLLGGFVPPMAMERILAQYDYTAHKRALPVTPF